MEWSLIVLFIILGTIVGAAAGFFGIGGGLVAIPVLLWIFEGKNLGGDSFVQLAFGTNLFIVIFTSALASYRHTKNGNVIWQVVPFLAVFSVIGALIGSRIANIISGQILKCIFSGILIYTGVQLIRKTGDENSHYNTLEDKKQRSILYTITGLLIGFVSGLTGLGGGTIAIPFMINLLHFPVKLVAGTSSAVMIFTSLAAASGYIYHGWGNPQLPQGSLGFVYLYAAIPLIIGTVLFSQVGANLNNRVKALQLQFIFAIFLLLVSVKMLIF